MSPDLSEISKKMVTLDLTIVELIRIIVYSEVMQTHQGAFTAVRSVAQAARAPPLPVPKRHATHGRRMHCHGWHVLRRLKLIPSNKIFTIKLC